MKLGILTSHPIQNQAPLFRALAEHCDLLVFFAHSQTPGGQAAAGFNVAFDWDVDLLAGYRSVFLENRATAPDTASFSGCNTPAIAAYIAEGGFDAFLVTGWNLLAYWQAIVACRRQRVPVMVRGDSHLVTARSGLKRILKAALYPVMLRNFSACLYVGQRNRDYLRHYGVTDARLFFSPHCIDNAGYALRASKADLHEVRRKLGIDADKKVVLYVGKLLPVKRVGDLLAALQHLQAVLPDTMALIVGDGPMRLVLEQQATATHVTAVFAGFRNQSELPALYAVADVVVLPSTGETWGLVVNEALACGTPVVVSDTVGCAADLVKDQLSGAIYPVGDPVALAAALQRVLAGEWDAAGTSALIAAYSADAAAEGVLAAMRHLSASAPVNR